MASSATPLIIDALVAQCSLALVGVRVTDGYEMSDDPNDGGVLMVGVEDGQSTSAAASSDSSQKQATAGTPRTRDQSGQVTCYALTWNGDNNQKAARDMAYAIQAGVENLLRTDPQLGIPRPNGQVVLLQLGDERLEQSQSDFGAEALLTFTVLFEARI